LGKTSCKSVQGAISRKSLSLSQWDDDKDTEEREERPQKDDTSKVLVHIKGVDAPLEEYLANEGSTCAGQGCMQRWWGGFFPPHFICRVAEGKLSIIVSCSVRATNERCAFVRSFALCPCFATTFVYTHAAVCVCVYFRNVICCEAERRACASFQITATPNCIRVMMNAKLCFLSSYDTGAENNSLCLSRVNLIADTYYSKSNIRNRVLLGRSALFVFLRKYVNAYGVRFHASLLCSLSLSHITHTPGGRALFICFCVC
jgi:hypothetical protein